MGPTGPYVVLNEGGDAGVFVGILDALDPLDATGSCIAVTLDEGGSATLWPDVLGPLVPDDDAASGAGDEGEDGR